MGGRGSASSGGAAGAAAGGGGRPEYLRETEKAVMLEARYRTNSMARNDEFGEKSTNVWIPKSQLDESGNPTEWIAGQKAKDLNASGLNASFNLYDAKGSAVKIGESAIAKERRVQKEAAFSNRDRLLDLARSKGVKVSSNMKSSTLRKRLKDAGVDY